MWQRQRASKSHWCEKNWNLRECSNCGMAWLGMVWHGVPWQRRLTALLIATVGEWTSLGVCECICLCVCGWRRLHTSMLMLACLAAASVVDILSLPLPLPWQAGSGRVSLVRFGILGRHFVGGRRVDWGWEQLLTECPRVCAGVGVETFTVDCANTQQQQQQQAGQ